MGELLGACAVFGMRCGSYLSRANLVKLNGARYNQRRIIQPHANFKPLTRDDLQY